MNVKHNYEVFVYNTSGQGGKEEGFDTLEEACEGVQEGKVVNYHKDIMVKRAEELIKDGRCRVQVTLIDDRLEEVDCSREYGYEYYDVAILAKILEIIR